MDIVIATEQGTVVKVIDNIDFSTPANLDKLLSTIKFALWCGNRLEREEKELQCVGRMARAPAGTNVAFGCNS